jgi:DNA polymerase-3 subunit delta'
MARPLDQILGHTKTKEVLDSLLKKKRFFSGALFSGPEGIGKKKTAMACLQELNGNDKLDGTVLHLIEPDKDKIKIEQVREAIDFISLQSWVEHRFIVIDQVDKITVQAANALLKSLEEPPQGVHFILITSNLSQVLPTIRSRCQVVNFEALKEEDLLQLCPGIENWQLHWCFGRLSLAQKIQQPEWLELRKQAINFLYNHVHQQSQKELVEQFIEAEKVDFIIHCWLTYIRDALLFAQGGREGFYNSDIVAFIEKFSRKEDLTGLYDSITQLRRDYAGNVDKNLIIENFSLDLSQGVYV